MAARSAEPSRTSAYSPDIGWRIVWKKLGMDYSFRRIAMNLQISVGTAHRIFNKFVVTGEVSPHKRPKRFDLRKLDDTHELFILTLVTEYPGIYLSEICHRINQATNVHVSPSTVCRIMHRNGFTRKKILHVAKQRSTALRSAFMANVLCYNNMFVWIDESGSDRRDQARKFGYAIRGVVPVYQRWLARGKRVSVIAAMCSDGLVDFELFTGTCDGERFFDFVRGSIIPNMHSFDGVNERSIVIMDNCAIHHVPKVLELFREAGILVLFLPPYSPDFSPIEELFSYIKYYLKNHEELLQEYDKPEHIIASAFHSVTQNKCRGWIRDCGY